MNQEEVRELIQGVIDTSSDLVMVEACKWLLEENVRLRNELRTSIDIAAVHEAADRLVEEFGWKDS